MKAKKMICVFLVSGVVILRNLIIATPSMASSIICSSLDNEEQIVDEELKGYYGDSDKKISVVKVSKCKLDDVSQQAIGSDDTIKSMGNVVFLRITTRNKVFMCDGEVKLPRPPFNDLELTSCQEMIPYGYK